MPVLLRSREVPLQVVLALLVPAAIGALAGWLLGVNEIAYLVVGALALIGGYFAGLEHRGAGEGAVRGVLGGALFGAVLLLVHEATGEEPTADLPEPPVVLVAITALIGTVSGALGGKRRANHEGKMAEAKEKDEKEEKTEESPFSIARLKWTEAVGFLGAAILLGSLFLPWFSTSCESRAEARALTDDCNANSVYNGMRGKFNAFETFGYLDYLLVAACIAPFILAYIIARGHALSWRPGEVTMIVGMTAFALVLLNGVILGKPGDTVDIQFEIGYLVGLIGSALLMAGGLLRQAVGGVEKKPPGVM